MKKAVIIIACIILLLTGCSAKTPSASASRVTSTASPTAKSAAPTATASPTATPSPTAQPTPEPTAIPVITPEPTVAIIMTPEPTPVPTLAPTPVPSFTAMPTPVDDMPMPTGLSNEDLKIRSAVKDAFRATYTWTDGSIVTNIAFEFNEAEVRQFVATGVTTGFTSFELMRDASDKPAFVVIKGGNDGYNVDQMAVIKRTVDKMNQIDSGVIRDMVDYGLRFLAYDSFKSGKFTRNPTWGSSYEIDSFGGTVFFNTIGMNASDPEMDFQVMALIFCESRALYTTRYATDAGQWFTNAPGMLDVRIGIDKGLMGIQVSNAWFAQGKITEAEKTIFQYPCNLALDYYKNLP